jgi:hypothetical protein
MGWLDDPHQGSGGGDRVLIVPRVRTLYVDSSSLGSFVADASI